MTNILSKLYGFCWNIIIWSPLGDSVIFVLSVCVCVCVFGWMAGRWVCVAWVLESVQKVCGLQVYPTGHVKSAIAIARITRLLFSRAY